ncbi:hypothetical protein [Candidatus Methylospira mobilis]|uniref:hypothetical protein n=1 Tax=Candidatus Methylospira mobilis TaxID=1808979 RepID=UPI0018852088|nr:hypothetical protein [Candidatus Methylospira mobilis]
MNTISRVNRVLRDLQNTNLSLLSFIRARAFRYKAEINITARHFDVRPGFGMPLIRPQRSCQHNDAAGKSGDGECGHAGRVHPVSRKYRRSAPVKQSRHASARSSGLFRRTRKMPP